MNKYELILAIDYDLPHDTFCYGSNIKDQYVSDIVSEFLHTQIGLGRDNSPPEKRDLYCIDIRFDLRTDTFRVRSNCGNKGLMNGIVMRFLAKLDRRDIAPLLPDDLFEII